MSAASDRLLAHMHYDSAAATLVLSDAAPALASVSEALHSAFGADVVVLSGVRTSVVAGTRPTREVLTAFGNANVFGARRDVLVELGIEHGEAADLLVLIPLPAKSWSLRTGFPEIPVDGPLAELQVIGGVLVISWRVSLLRGSRKVGTRTVTLGNAQLIDGLQLIGTGLVRGGAALPETYWAGPAADSGLLEQLPDRQKRPTYVEVRVDRVGGVLTLEAWWDAVGVPPDLTSAPLLANGLALASRLDGTGSPQAQWLWEIDVGAEDPLVLRASVWSGSALCFAAYPPRPLPLGNSIAAISDLAHTDLSGIVGADRNLDLRSIEYTAGRSLSLAVGVGDPGPGASPLVTVGPFELRDVVYAVQSRFTRGSTSWLEATVSAWSCDFLVHYEPDVLISGRVSDPSGVALGALIEGALAVSLPFGLDTLTLRAASWEYEVASAITTVAVQVDGDVELVPRAISLRSVRLGARRSAAGGQYTLGAVFSLGPVSLLVQGTRLASGGWVLSGTAVAEPAISLRAVVSHLVEALGASVPDEVPDVLLREIGVEFNTADSSLSIHAITSFVVPAGVPVLSGEEQVVLSLDLAKDPSGKRVARITIDWSLERGGRQFGANVVIASTMQHFGVDFSAGAEPVTLTELTSALGVAGELPQGELLDELFQLTTFSLSYSRPSGDLDLAFSRTLGAGVLLLELDRSAVARRFSASWIASDEGGTLGVRDLARVAGHERLVDEAEAFAGAVGLGGMAQEVEQLLTFRELGFTWDSAAGNQNFLFLARSEHPALDETFVRFSRGTNPGFMAGAAFRPGKGIGDLPFVPDVVGTLLDGALGGMHLVPTGLLFSTVADGHFVPPGFDQAMLVPTYGRPGVSAPRRPFGQTWMRVGKGVALGMRVTIPEDSPVRQVIDATELDAQLTISTTSVALQASLNGTVRLGEGDFSLSLGDPMLRAAFTSGIPELDLGGTVEMALFGCHMSAAGWLSIGPESVAGHIELRDVPWLPLNVLPGVHFESTQANPFYLEVGFQFEPPGLDLGVQGHWFIWTKHKVYQGSLTVVLEIVEIIPQPLYVDFTIDELDIPGLLEALTGLQYDLHLADTALDALATVEESGAAAAARTDSGLAHAGGDVLAGAATVGRTVAGGLRFVEGVIDHLECILTGVSIDDVLFRWCDSVVSLPDGSVQMPGVAFHGRITLFGWRAFALLEFSSAGIPSLNGHFEAEPINIGGVLRIWGDGQGIRTAPHSAGDLAARTALAAAPPSESDEWFIKPGGPVFHVSTSASPFLHASLHACLFGFISADIQADVTDEGFAFDFHVGIGNAVTAELECHYWKQEARFEAHGELGLHLHGEIGPIIPGIECTRLTLNTDLVAYVELVVDGEHFEMRVRGEFNFQGLRLTVPELVINVAFASLSALADYIWDRIKALAGVIFDEVIGPVVRAFEEAGRAIVHVAEVAADWVEDQATVVAEQVTAIAQTVEHGVMVAVDAVAEVANRVATAAREVVGRAADAASAAAAPLLAEADRLWNEGGSAAEVAAHRVEAIALEIAAAAVAVGAFVSDLLNQASVWVGEKLRQAEDWCRQRLADAKAWVDDLWRRTREGLATVAAMIQSLVDEIARLGEEIKHFFEDVGHAFEDFGHDVAKVCD